jgi:diketogulonate reductase-like aldo/keto reductase
MTTKTSLTDTYQLNDGKTIPCVGFGTWQIPDGDAAANSVKAALEAGYRHIDTASAYNNEESVGRGVVESGLKREDVYLTTKLWNTDRGYETTLKAASLSLKKLGVDFIDLYLIHWPANDVVYDDPAAVNAATWRAFEKLQKDGLVRSIGVSNFWEQHLQQIFDVCEVKPAVNQIECHPGYPQFETIEFCRQHDIVVEAWSPLGRGTVLTDERLKAIADRYGKSTAQLSLRWELQHGLLPLPKSVNPERIQENAQIFDFVISDEDMKTIDELPEFGYSTFSPLTLKF